MNQSWSHKNIAREIQFSPRGVLLWPTSDSAPNGWGAPFDILPGSVGGDRPNVLLTYADPATVKVKRGIVRSSAGNCYWRGPQGDILSWQGPWGFQAPPPIHFVSASGYSAISAPFTYAFNALVDIGYTPTYLYAPESPANPTGPGTRVIFGSRFSSGIFQRGKLIATAPSNVLGAAKLGFGIVAILDDQTVRYKKGSAGWITIGTLSNPTISDTSKTLLPHMGVFSFDSTGHHAIAVRMLICPRTVVGFVTTQEHVSTLLTRVTITDDGAGNLGISVSHTDPDAAALILSAHRESSYTAPPPPYTTGGSGSLTSTSAYSTEGETILAAGFRGNTEVILSAKVYDTSQAGSNTSSGHSFGDGGENADGSFTGSSSTTGSNKVGLYSGATRLVDLWTHSRTHTSTSSEEVSLHSTSDLNSGASSSSSTDSETSETSTLLFTDVSLGTPVYTLVKYVNHSQSTSSGTFEFTGPGPGSFTNSGSRYESRTYSIINPNTSFAVDESSSSLSNSGEAGGEAIWNFGFYPDGTYNVTYTTKLFNIVEFNRFHQYALPSGEFLNMFPTCYGVVDDPSGFCATVNYLYTVNVTHQSDGWTILQTTSTQLPNGETPASILGLTGTHQALGHLPDKGVYLL